MLRAQPSLQPSPATHKDRHSFPVCCFVRPLIHASCMRRQYVWIGVAIWKGFGRRRSQTCMQCKAPWPTEQGVQCTAHACEPHLSAKGAAMLCSSVVACVPMGAATASVASCAGAVAICSGTAVACGGAAAGAAPGANPVQVILSSGVMPGGSGHAKSLPMASTIGRHALRTSPRAGYRNPGTGPLNAQKLMSSTARSPWNCRLSAVTATLSWFCRGQWSPYQAHMWRLCNKESGGCFAMTLRQAHADSKLQDLLFHPCMQSHEKLLRTCAENMPDVARLAGMVPPSAPLKLMLRYTALPKALLGRTSASLAQEGRGLCSALFWATSKERQHITHAHSSHCKATRSIPKKD